MDKIKNFFYTLGLWILCIILFPPIVCLLLKIELDKSDENIFLIIGRCILCIILLPYMVYAIIRDLDKPAEVPEDIYEFNI